MAVPRPAPPRPKITNYNWSTSSDCRVARRNLAALLQRTRAILFDFDGPICSVFAGQPAPTVARELREQLAEWGADVPTHDDPLVLQL